MSNQAKQKESKMPQINKIYIQNFMGIEDLIIEPSSLTVISGKNASGKTSVLEAMKATVGSGHDPSVVNAGAEAAQVVITLDSGKSIRLRVTAKSTTREIRNEKGRRIDTPPAEFIRSISDALSVNPLAFLTAKPADQLTAFLEAFPLRLRIEDIAFLPEAFRQITVEGHALEVISKLQRAVYGERQEVNRIAKEKEATVRQLSETLPAEAPAAGDWKAELDKLTAAEKDLQTTTFTATSNIREAWAAAKENAKYEFERRRDAIREALTEKIDELKARAARRIDELEGERDGRIDYITRERDEQLDVLAADYRPKEEKLIAGREHAQVMVDAQGKATRTREYMATQEREAEAARVESQEMTNALINLQKLKSKLLIDLPIAGLEIKDGAILIDGILLGRVNRARQIQIAIELAKLRAGDLGFIVIDDLEHFDSETFEAFKEGAKDSGLQFVCARVSDCESLQIETQ
jgi:DNA repair exonuclease SbcCD ATPase subunit